MRTTTLTLLLLVFLPYTGFAQASSSTDFKKFGIGLGYSFPSFMSDSIRPIELSFRYRINDKHTLQLYAPLSYKKASIRNLDDTRKETLWGLGLGYDYTFYSYDYLSFFVGLSGDYQWYESRRDFFAIYDAYYDGDIVGKVEKNYFDWKRVNGLSINPGWGIRLIFSRMTIEANMGLSLSMSRHKRYAYSKEIHPASTMEGESFFPENNIRENKFIAKYSIKIHYYF